MSTKDPQPGDADEKPEEGGELARWLDASPDERATIPDSDSISLARELAALAPLLDKQEPPPQAHDISIPEHLGRYRIEGRLGSGGAGRVFRAFDTQLHREVAVKLLDVKEGAKFDESERLLAEARALAMLNEPGIVKVHEVAEHEGQPFLVMEIAQGPTLKAVLEALRAKESGAPAVDAGADSGEDTAAARAAARELGPLARRLELIEKLARSVEHCHANGVLHRDLKPGNVLVSTGGSPRIVDFGLSHREDEKLDGTLTIGFVGTPAYLSPEQIERKRTGASASSDVFALGILLYELLTLEHPFLRSTLVETHAAILAAHPAAPRSIVPAISRDLERVILSTLEKDPLDRYESAARLAADLQAVRGHRAVSVVRRSVLNRGRRWIRRHPRTTWGAAIALLALITAAVVANALAADRAESIRERLDEALVFAEQASLEEGLHLDRIDELEGIARESQSFDESVLGRLRGTALHERAEQRLHSYSTRRLSEVQGELERLMHQPSWIERESSLRSFRERLAPSIRRWTGLANVTERHALLDRAGRLELPPGARLFAIASPEVFVDERRFVPSDLEAVSATELFLIRRQRDKSGHGAAPAWEERLWVVTPLDLPAPPTLHPLDATISRELHSYDLSAWRSPNGDVASSWDELDALPRLVTWRDVERIAGPDFRLASLSIFEQVAAQEFTVPALEPDAPAVLRPEDVVELTALAGARLPTPNELRALWDVAESQAPFESISSAIDKEWVADLASDTRTLGYLPVGAAREAELLAAESAGAPPPKSELNHVRGVLDTGAGFRLVFGRAEPTR